MLNPERRRRAVHKLAVAAAALAVCVLPTACDSLIASPPGAPIGGNSGGDNTTAPVVVPVGNTTDASATTQRSRDRDRNRGTPSSSSSATSDTTAPTTTTSVAPAATTDPTDPAIPPVDDASARSTTATAPPAAPAPAPAKLDLLGRTCAESKKVLPTHNGFQSADAQCVTTQMGEIAAENHLPSLLITAAPRVVGVGRSFMLAVSTRNLIRDRFLGAAAGGYYLESSFLDPKSGLQRGHFHTACRMLSSTGAAPDSAPAPAFFLATQDLKGGSAPDTVTIEVPATATQKSGTMQCSSWAGDGSHRTPMMSRANQTPAFDSVRIQIFGRDRAVQNDINPADAQKDAQQQATAEQQVAGTQAPDQNGATQLGPEAQAAAKAADTAAPAEAPAADESAAPASSESAAPDAAAGDKSLQERFQELQDSRQGG